MYPTTSIAYSARAPQPLPDTQVKQEPTTDRPIAEENVGRKGEIVLRLFRDDEKMHDDSERKNVVNEIAAVAKKMGWTTSEELPKTQDPQKPAALPNRKIVLWCGERYAVADDSMYDDAFFKLLRERVKPVTVEKKKFLDTDNTPDCLYIRSWLPGARCDHDWDSQTPSTYAKGNCVWQMVVHEDNFNGFVGVKNVMDDILKKSGVHGVKTPQDHHVILIPCARNDSFKYVFNDEQRVRAVEEIVAVTKKMGWD